MIVGNGVYNGHGETVWPNFELLTGGYYFTYRGDDGSFLGKIAEFDFDHWRSWIKDRQFNDLVLETFKFKPKSMGEILLLNHGCHEAMTELDGLMWEYYDDHIG